MSRSRWLAIVLVAGAWLGAAHASAQASSASAATAGRNETLRLAVGVGPSVVTGPDMEVDGEKVANESPSSLPMPELLVRADYPVHKLALVGVQGSVFMWKTSSDAYFGSSHYSFDVSALARLRIRFGSYGRHEITASVPFGPTVDNFELGPRSDGASLENHVGWHTGLFAGYQYLTVRRPWGFFAEVGFTYHQLSKTIEYRLEPGERATEELSYQPIELFIRGGVMLLPYL